MQRKRRVGPRERAVKEGGVEVARVAGEAGEAGEVGEVGVEAQRGREA